MNVAPKGTGVIQRLKGSTVMQSVVKGQTTMTCFLKSKGVVDWLKGKTTAVCTGEFEIVYIRRHKTDDIRVYAPDGYRRA